MRILALETTEMSGSVAALCDGNLLSQLDLNPQQRSAQSLAPGLGQLWRQVGWHPTDVELVAVTAGPGSFTGLRVGVTTAKILAYALGAEILGVDTLEVIASRAPDHAEALWAAIDAQRGQVVARSFQRGTDGWLIPLGPEELIDVGAWLAALPPGTTVTGPVLGKLAGRVPEHVEVLAPQYWSPTAAAVGRLAARQYQAGRRDDVWSLLPRYSRRAAAEEKRQQRQSDGPRS